MDVINSNAQTNTHNNTRGETILLGPVAGFGSSWVGYAPGSAMAVPSGYGGIGLIDIKGPHWGWGGQLVLSSEGYKTSYPRFQQKDIPLYLRLPVRAYYFFGNRSNIVRPDIYLGPSFGMKASEHMITNNYLGDVTNDHNASNFRLFDAGIDGGAGVNIQLSRQMSLNLALEYYQGITDALKDAADTYNTDHDFDLTLGLLFDLR
jgi:hypothetical protein